MTIKYGKLYMKDTSGNLQQIMPESHATITEYQGATTNAPGVPGLVPPALASQKDKFLRGDGQWATMYDDNVVPLSGTNIDLTSGRTFTKTITENTTFTITNATSGKMTIFNIALTNAGAYTITWPSSVKWHNSVHPQLTANGLDILSFMTLDGGTTWYGSLIMGGII